MADSGSSVRHMWDHLTFVLLLVRTAHQQGFKIQHMLFAQDDKGRRATESVAAVRLQTRHPA